MSVDEPRITCPACNGTGDLPIRAVNDMDDMRRRLVLLEQNNSEMSIALIDIASGKSKKAPEVVVEEMRRRARACAPYWVRVL